jgi:hypothetical protein
MRKKYGKWYARWTGPDGRRHEKACPTRKAAETLTAKERARTLRKKARATLASTRSAGRGSRRARTKTT